MNILKCFSGTYQKIIFCEDYSITLTNYLYTYRLPFAFYNNIAFNPVI
jgi:hypothetical protein